MTRRLAVIGAGAWGTALAVHAASAGHAVRLWVFEPDLLERLRETRENEWYLPGIRVSDRVTAVGSLDEVSAGADLAIVAVPTHVFRRVVSDLASRLDPTTRVLSATKGIEEESLARPSEILAEVLAAPQRDRIAVLSGPTFALEVAQGRPTAAVLASVDAALAGDLQQTLATPTFRLYTQRDVTGVELGGALKNVMAVAAGISDGLELGDNARAALLTRGLAEITRLGVALGARAGTFSGLAGLGDLLLTCTGALSRNRRLGLALARGTPLAEWEAGTRSVAEGVRTTRAALALAQRAGVATPITREVGAVLFAGKSPRDALVSLLDRDVRAEEDHEDPARWPLPGRCVSTEESTRA